MSSPTEGNGTGDAGESGQQNQPDEQMLALVASTEQGISNPDVYRSLAEMRLSGHDALGAVVTLDRGLRFAGAHAPLLVLRGQALTELTRHDEALEAFEWAMALVPTSIMPRLESANSLGRLGRFEECLARIETVLDQEPGRLDATYTKAEALRLLDRQDEALIVTKQLLASTPDDGDVHRLYTFILRSKGEGTAALAAADQWVQVAPDDPAAHLTRAGLLIDANRFEEASAAFDTAIALDHTSIEALLGKAEVLDHLDMTPLERRSAQLELVDDALRFEPGHQNALRQRAWLLWTLDRSAEAITEVERAIGSDEPDPWLLGLYADAQADLGRWAAAVEAYEQLAVAEQLDSFSVGRLVQYGAALRILGRLEDARAVLDVALAKNPNDGPALAESAEVHRLNSDDALALEQLDRALANDHRTVFVLGTRGEVLTSLGRFDEALASLDQALAAGEPEAWVYTARGEALRNLDRYEEAIEAFDQALELAPDDRWNRSLRCEAIRQQGNAREALELADGLLSEDPDDAFMIGTRAAALADLSRYQDALDAIGPLLEREPDYYFGWTVKTDALARLDRHTEAHVAADRLLLVQPADLWGVIRKAQLFEEQGRYAESVAYMTSMEPSIEPSSGFRLIQGRALSRLDRLPESIEKLNDAKERGNSVRIVSELADVMAMSEQSDRARELRADALALLPDDTPPDSSDLARAAWCSLHLGDLEAAVRHYLRATSVDPFVIEWQFELAMAEFSAGQRSVAAEQLTTWREAIKRCPDSTRAAGIVREGRESFRRAERFGLLRSLEPSAREEIVSHLMAEERTHPVYEGEASERAQ